MDLPEGTSIQKQTRTVSQNQSKILSLTLSLTLGRVLNPSQNPPQKEFPHPIPSSGKKTFAGIHHKSETTHKDQVIQDLYSVEEYHSAQKKTSRIFRGECSHRKNLAKHVPSFTPVVQHHLFREKDITLNTTMEINFLW